MDGRGSEGGGTDPRRDDDRDRRSGREDQHRRSERRPATTRDDERERDRDRDVREREREKDRSRRESDREPSRRDRDRERDAASARLPTGPARDDRMQLIGNSPGRKRPRDPRDEEVRSLKS